MRIGEKIIYHANVSSTNDIAGEMINDGSGYDGLVISAGFQTKGRGQRKNTWTSEPFMNLTMSVILEPEKLLPEDQFYLSMIVSLAITDALSAYSGRFSIKWPNDIYHEGDKIAGILIENTISGSSISSCIAGMGININQESFPAELPNPVSLCHIVKGKHNVQQLQDEVCSYLEQWYTALRNKDFEGIGRAYTDRLYLLGKEADFDTADGRIRGTLIGVNSSGQLLINTIDGEERTFSFKEVEFTAPPAPSR